MDFKRRSTILITCGPGLGSLLRAEVEALGYRPQKHADTGLEITGTLEDTLRLNLHLRTAYNVLYRIDRFPCPGPDQLYRRVQRLPWEKTIATDGYLTVTSRVSTPSITNTMFPNLKVKDAVVDRVQRATGRRPDSGGERHGVVVHLTWTGQQAALYLNTSGVKLSDRGYRHMPWKAPLRETLAAALILATGYDGSTPLVTPMCGSGTLAIEAALLGLGRPPGILRDKFGFMHLLGFDRARWEAVRREATQATRRELAAPIIVSDIAPGAVDAARRSAVTAGVDHLIRFQVSDFAETALPDAPGRVILNPGYGHRVGDEEELGPLYKRIGDFFKQRCAGWTGFLFTGNPRLAKQVGLRTSRRQVFHNGNIECRLLRYEMYSGSRRGDETP